MAIITKNEELNLDKTLSSIHSIADEIIVVDSGSTDRTKEIAEKYGAKFIFEEWKGYGPQKNSVIQKCTGDWILNIDADEEISIPLLAKLKDIKENENQKKVFLINRSSVCFGKRLRYGGWSGDYIIRLFKKGTGKYNDNVVHEKFITNEDTFKIKEEIYHHSYHSIEEYLTRFNRYTTEGAIEGYKRNKNAGIANCIVNPILKFIRMYFIRLGFLDGMEGLLIAILSANYTRVKYFKLREIYKNGTYIEK